MKLLCSCLLVSALLTPSLLQAQANAKPAAGPQSKPVTAATKTRDAAALKAEAEKVHKVAVMTVVFGGEPHQIIFELLPKGAPQTVANFIENVEKGTYKDLAFHRTISDYLVQTGDPASKDDSRRSEWGLGQEYNIPGEFGLKHSAGSVAMARRGDKVNPSRRSDGTQFYFALGDLSSLDGQYAVFGQVVSGLDTLKKISRVVHDSNDCPLERITIKNIKVVDHKGPLISLKNSEPKKGKRNTRPEALKGPIEKLLDRVW